MMGRKRKCCCRDCSNVPGMSVSFLSVSVVEDERYKSWSPGCSGDAWHQWGSLYRLLGYPVVSLRGSLELSYRGSMVVGSS